MLNRKYILIAGILILALGLGLVLSFNMGALISKAGGVVLEGGDFTNGEHDLTARVMGSGDKRIDTYSTVIPREALEKIEGDNFHVVIYHLNAQAYSIYFNGKHIGTAGDIKNARSNAYSSIGNFIIHREDLQSSNVLEIKTHSLYMAGLEQHPIGILSCDAARKVTGHLGFLSEGLNMMGLGILSLGVLLTFFMILLNEKKNLGLIYLLAGVLCFMVYSMEFMYMPHLPFDFIVFKKLMMFSLFLCIFFLSLSIMHFLESKISIVVSSLSLAIITVSVIFVNDLVLFKQIYTVLVVGIGANFLIWTIAAMRDYKPRDESVVFTYGMACFFMFAVADSISLVLIGGTSSNSIIMYSIVFSFILICLFYLEITRRNIRINSESSQRHQFYTQAITDSLTGAYNKSYVMDSISESEYCSIAMLDIDNFKKLNDTYGHPAGDFILKRVTEIMKHEFRETDIVGRYGGDEFIIVLRDCSVENAFNVVEKLRLKVETEIFRYSGNDIHVTISAGISLNDKNDRKHRVVERADEALYRAKNAGRNRVSL
jgi:diguanylate cyclase (GGDEF)-like protein